MSSGAWWGRSPAAARRLDLGICIGVAAVGIGGEIAVTAGADLASMPLSVGGVVLSCLAGASLWWRRSRPLLALCGGVLVLVVAGGWREPGLFAVQAFTTGAGLALDARLAAVAVAAVLLWRRAPFIVVVLAAAAVAAVLRGLGIG